MGWLSNKVSRETLKPGDHIYSWRLAYIYAHHGIYIGDDKVIHFTCGDGQEVGTGTPLDRIIFSSSPSKPSSDTPCPQCGDQSATSGVISSCLTCFLDGGELYLFSYAVSPALFLAQARGGTCTTAKPDPHEHAVHRATHLLENGFGEYNIFKNNCEDFAIYCKTGLLLVTGVSVGRSGQASAVRAAVKAVYQSKKTAVISPLRYLTTVAAVAFEYCVCRLESDIGARRDTIKVPVERLVSADGIGSDEARAANLEMKTL